VQFVWLAKILHPGGMHVQKGHKRNGLR